MEDMLRYIDNIVEPTIEDLRKNKTSVRHAFLACVATFHAIDYLSYDSAAQKPRKGKVGNFRHDYGSESADFKLVDDVAHAFKHVAVGPSGHPTLRAGGLTPRRAGTFGDFMFGEHSFNDTGEWVTLESNRNVRLLDVIERTVSFLRGKASI